MSNVTTDITVLTVPSDLSQGQDIDFCQRITEIVDQGAQHLHFDCSDLNLVHSSHIGLLWKAKEICRQKSTTVVLENTSVSLMRTLQALDLMDVFEFSENCDSEPALPTAKLFLNQTGKPHSGQFDANIAGVDHGLCEFMELLEGWQLTEEMKFDMRTLFYETATNIRCHSGLPPNSMVKYQATCTEGVLQLTFEDQGTPFNPLSLPDDYIPESAAQNRQTRGFGILLIRRLADNIEYTHRDTTTNVLTLTKRYGDRR